MLPYLERHKYHFRGRATRDFDGVTSSSSRTLCHEHDVRIYLTLSRSAACLDAMRNTFAVDAGMALVGHYEMGLMPFPGNRLYKTWRRSKRKAAWHTRFARGYLVEPVSSVG